MWVDPRAIRRELGFHLLRGFGLTLLLALFVAAALLLPLTCEAQADEELELEAAAALARYAVNEAGWSSPADALLLWQVATVHAEDRGHPDLAGTLLELRRRSRCVLARRRPAEWPPGNCRWSRYLDRSGDPPRNWRAGPEAWADRCRALWFALLDYCLGVVRGEEPRPCEGRPQTWDGWGPGDSWHTANLADGFVLVACADPYGGGRLLNAAYRYPPRSR